MHRALFLALTSCLLAHGSTIAAPVMRIIKSSQTADNLARNGGFEQLAPNQSNAFAGWDAAPKGYRVGLQQGRDGSTGLRCDNSSGEGWFGAEQSFRLNRASIAPLIVRGWSKAQQVSGSPDNDYSLYVDITYQDGSTLWGQTANFRCGTHDWEQREFTILPERPVKDLTLYCLFRKHAGTVWFDDISLQELTAGPNAVMFQGIPIQAAATVPAPAATSSTHQTRDGLRLTLRDQTVTSIALDDHELASPAPGGFLVRDVAARSDICNFSNRNCPELGLEINYQVLAHPDHLAFDGKLTDLSSKDRAVMLLFALPIDATRWLWHDDIRRHRLIESSAEYVNQVTVGCGSTASLSLYPLAGIANDRFGLALALDMASPAQYRLVYHAGTRQFFIAFDFGLVPETQRFPSSAPFRFVLYRFDPKGGFRAAFHKLTQIFPDYFLVRAKDQGLWMPFTDISTVERWQDFGFKYHEGNNNVPFDDAHDILSFRYTEPMTWWMSMKKDAPRTLAEAIRLRDALTRDAKSSAARLAQASVSAAMFDESGGPSLLFRDTPWCNGAVWSLNPNPFLPGPVNAASIHWNPTTKQQLYGPAAKGRLDGEYLDSLEGYVTAELNFRREHFRHTTVPLTFSTQTRRPALFKGLAVFEFTHWMAEDVHRLGKLTFANGVPYRFSFLAPWLDVLGTETDWLSRGQYRPASHTQLCLWRTMSGQKPYVLLMNTDYDAFTPALVEKYFQRALFYGMFPGMFSHNAADNPYWRNPKWYNRDRPLFKKYIPLIKQVAEAGWQPLTYAACDDSHILIERFGPNTAGQFYLTLFNDDTVAREGLLSIELERLPVAQSTTPTELLSGQPLPPGPPWRISLPAQSAKVVRLQTRAP